MAGLLCFENILLYSHVSLMQESVLTYTGLGFPDNQSKAKAGPLSCILLFVLCLGARATFPPCCPCSGDHEQPTLGSPLSLAALSLFPSPGTKALRCPTSPRRPDNEAQGTLKTNGLHSKAFSHPAADTAGSQTPGVGVPGPQHPFFLF